MSDLDRIADALADKKALNSELATLRAENEALKVEVEGWKEVTANLSKDFLEATETQDAQIKVLSEALHKELEQGNGWVDENTNHIKQALSTIPAEAPEEWRLEREVVENSIDCINRVKSWKNMSLITEMVDPKIPEKAIQAQEKLEKSVEALEAQREKAKK